MKVRAAHCLFEQSGTFKNEFIKLGIPAYDYDIVNNDNVDYNVDLFVEIEKAYNNKSSIFDNIKKDDITIAFFPCVYFNDSSQMYFMQTSNYYMKKNMTKKEIGDYIIKREIFRSNFYKKLIMLKTIFEIRKNRLIIENPSSYSGYLKNNFIKPSYEDGDRYKHGDYFKKPTWYWFINCEPQGGLELVNNKHKKRSVDNSKPSGKAGICSIERSLISPEYANNFIRNLIIKNKKEKEVQLSLF